MNGDDTKYVLHTARGDEFVRTAKTTGMETVKIHFTFTKDIKKAKRFTMRELKSGGVGIAFTCGFSGGGLKEV